MTGSRPADWSPLAASDPVPGDPVQMRNEAARYGAVADRISQQVARLRTIGASQELCGRYVGALRGAANELADHLQKVHGRYQEVSSELTVWADDLETAQAESVKVLESAQAAESEISRHTSIAPAPQPGDPPLTAAQQYAATLQQRALDGAKDALAQAHARLAEVTARRDDAAARAAARIRKAVDDGITDSWWDSVKEWVHRNAGWLKKLTELLSWIATALAVMALFIPGVNLIAILAIGFTVATLLGHSTLAATGEGSLTDVALDVFVLATMGGGRIFTRLAGAGRLLALSRASKLEGAAARGAVFLDRAPQRAVLKETSALRTAAGRNARKVLRGFDQESLALADSAGFKAQAMGMARLLPETGVVQRLASGGDETVAAMKVEIGQLTSHPGRAALGSPLDLYTGGARTAGASFAVGGLSDTTDKFLGGSSLPVISEKWSWAAYDRAKASWTIEVGSTW